MSREATAWHEGGHLAAAHCLGGRLGGASIRPGHWHLGQAEVHLGLDAEQLEAGWWAAVLGEPVKPELRDQVERIAMMHLAGWVTEIRAGERDLFTVEPPPDPHSPAERTRFLAAVNSGEPRPPSDLEATDALLRRITATEEEAVAYRELLIERTFTLASMNPLFWPLAEAFARELLIHDELSGAQVAAIVAEVNGEFPDAVPIPA